MDSNRTLSTGLADTPGAHDDTPRPVLVVAWCPAEPHRLGESVVAPPGAWRVLGRGRPQEGEPHPRALLVRQRPAETRPAPPLAVPVVSRVQLLVRYGPSAVDVVSRGRLPLLVHGEPVARARLEPGSTCALGDQLLLYCDRRPAMLEPVEGLPPHDFGQADAFGIVGESPAAWQLRQQVAFVGRRDLHTLVLGESGTGKELAARALHALSGRASGPFVARNAATLPEGLVDAEMFGHVASYPHAGMPARPGLVGAAHTGTLFLDELAELPKELQAHLLRLLDDGEYHRLGDTRTSRADVRVIGATNRPLEAFREDVRARFPLHVRVPALSARRADVPLLLRHLLRQAADEDPDLRARFFDDAGEPRLTVAYVAAMLQDLPAGNVRGLRAALWRDMGAQQRGALDAPWRPASATSQPTWDLGLDPADLPAEHIQACLDAHDGVQEAVWRALGLDNRFVLRRLIRAHGLVIRKGGGSRG